MYNRFLIVVFILTGVFEVSMAQPADVFRNKLDSIATYVPALNEKIDFTVNDLPLHEFIRGVANEAGLNVNLDQGLNESVSNNFTNVQVKDLLYFVKRNYQVDIEIIGNILNIKRIPQAIPPKEPSVIVNFDKEKSLITLEANSAPVDEVSREITRVTGVNVVAKPNARSIKVSSFIKNLPLASAFQKLAIANDLSISETEEGFFVFESIASQPAENTMHNTPNNRNSRNLNLRRNGTSKSDIHGLLDVTVYHKDSIDIKAENAEVRQVVQELFLPLGLSYQFIGEIAETVSLETKGASLKHILEELFAGLDIAIRKVNNTYWIGSREVVEMKEVKIVPMRYRSIDSLQYIIPENLKTDMEIIDYPDLNSLILAGPSDRIQSLSAFLKQVDKLIPVVLIEVIIIDNNDSRQLSTGITAGLTDETVTTSGSVLPSADLTLSSNSINKLIDGFNGLGWVNLGKVKSNFYMTLSALDENGYVNIKSTPQLATMNGHSASMSIGRTEYYKEELNTLYGSVTSSSQTTTTYKPVEAELKMEIKPIISGNQDITLQISVEQSDFTDRIESNAPPGKVSRKFESMIRIKDQEMILLGGLEEAEKSDTRSGMPLLSRIPVVNWVFSSKNKVKSEGKLNIFIKPTIIN